MVNPGYAVTFDGTSSSQDRPDRSIVSYEWDFFYDGSFKLSDTGAVVTHSYAATGTYTIALRVTDNNVPARTSITTGVVSVVDGNVLPVPKPGGPYAIDIGSALNLDGSASFDPNDAIVSYLWDLDDDRVFDDASGATPTITWSQLVGLGLGVGTHRISLKVTDMYGSSKLQTTQLTIYDLDPTAGFTVLPGTAVGGGDAFSFDASASAAARPDRGIVSYEWDFDYNLSTFNPSATGMTAARTYPSIGSHRVALRVTDNNSPARTNITYTVVTVEARNAPRASAGAGHYYIVPGQTLDLDGSASFDPDSAYGDSIVNYTWDLNGDGVFGDAIGVQPAVTWSQFETLLTNAGLPTIGVVPVTVRVTDTTGRTGDGTTCVTIRDEQPHAVIKCLVINAGPGQTITFDGGQSYHGSPTHTIAAYEWDFDRRDTFTTDATGVVVTHEYWYPGTYTCELRIADDDMPARIDTATVMINVNQGLIPPVAHPGGPYTVISGSSVNMNGSSSYSLYGPLSYRWDLNNDGSFGEATGVAPTVAWAQLVGLGLGTGSHTIWLEVTDSFGLTNRSYTRLDIK